MYVVFFLFFVIIILFFRSFLNIYFHFIYYSIEVSYINILYYITIIDWVNSISVHQFFVIL